MQKKAEVSWNHCYNKGSENLLKSSDRTDEGAPKSNDSENELSEKKIKLLTSAEFLKVFNKLTRSSQKFEYIIRFR